MVYIVDNYIVPNTAILDPRFTMTLPAFLTASTAMDAMTHAVEALTSICPTPFETDMPASHPVNRRKLRAVVADGKEEKARINMQLAAADAVEALMRTPGHFPRRHSQASRNRME